MQSSNPAIAVMTREAGTINFGGTEAAATVSGTANKSLLLAAVTVVCGYLSMDYALQNLAATGTAPRGIMTIAIIVALIVALVTCFKPNFSPVTAPIYAVSEGVGLGTLSAFFETRYPGIVSTAIMATFVVVMCMLALWKFKVVVVTAKFRSVVIGATGAIFILYILNFILGIFGINLLPHSGPLAIGISVVICAVAALNLILDFENIQIACDQGLPKYFEFFNAFSLLVTICWLYIEILRLLAHLREE